MNETTWENLVHYYGSINQMRRDEQRQKLVEEQEKLLRRIELIHAEIVILDAATEKAQALK